MPGLRDQLQRMWARATGSPIHVWYDEAYRWPLSSSEANSGVDPRRADDVLWYLLRAGATARSWVRRPLPASYEDLARVHSNAYLESLSRPEVLAPIFAADPADLAVDEVLHTIRLACGATVEAARTSLVKKRPCLNLLGGFHHAAPSRGAGFCAMNDVAVAVAAVRHDGFAGLVGIIDVDAHPPDGTAECLRHDARLWHGSLSGSDWGLLPGVVQVPLPDRCDDEAYLKALDGLLASMPKLDLAFVLAGGDVLLGDRLGRLGLSLSGARQRDLRIHRALEGVPAVWLPAGGYSAAAWKVLAGTGLALAFRSMETIPSTYDPLAARFLNISRGLSPESLGSEPILTEEDVAEALGQAPRTASKLLGFYTREGIEFALFQLGILRHLRRLGYDPLRVVLDRVGSSGRVRVLGASGGIEHVLIEVEAERRTMAGGTFLFINWASLRNPRGRFSPLRPQLPGQDVPGLGLAPELAEVLALMARRLVLDGVAFRPAWYHVAYAGRYRAQFVDPRRQGRFEALVRDLKGVPLLEATLAVAEGRVQMNGTPYQWEAEDMVLWLHPPKVDDGQIAAESDRVRFTMVPPLGRTAPVLDRPGASPQ